MAVPGSTGAACVPKPSPGSSAVDGATARAARHFPGTAISAVLRWIRSWLRRPVERRALANLSDHYLRDIGLTAADVEAERHLLSLRQPIETIRLRDRL